MNERERGKAPFPEARRGLERLGQDRVGLRDPPRFGERNAELDLDAGALARVADAERERPLEQVGGGVRGRHGRRARCRRRRGGPRRARRARRVRIVRAPSSVR